MVLLCLAQCNILIFHHILGIDILLFLRNVDCLFYVGAVHIIGFRVCAPRAFHRGDVISESLGAAKVKDISPRPGIRHPSMEASKRISFFFQRHSFGNGWTNMLCFFLCTVQTKMYLCTYVVYLVGK